MLTDLKISQVSGMPTAFGTGSIALGTDVLASGIHAVSIGSQAHAIGDNAVAIGGEANWAYGDHSIALGSNVQAEGLYSFASGWFSLATGTASYAGGYGNEANGNSSMAIGRYNEPIVSAGYGYDDGTPLFIVGNGDGDMTRSNALVIFKNGEVGIGTDSPSEILDVDGRARFRGVDASLPSTNDLRVTANGTLTTNTSDMRLKEDIRSIENALHRVLQLRGVTFTWKADPESGAQLGLIAQEVQKVFPDLVHESQHGLLGVDYSEMVGVFVEAIKEQQFLIDQQAAEIERLKSLEARIEALERHIPTSKDQ